MLLRIIWIIVFTYIPFLTFAQKIKKVDSEYIYYVPSSQSVDEAKRIALERAKIQAIADEFGTIISQNNSTVVSNPNGDSHIRMLSIGESEVKGEWIETIGTPSFELSYQDNMLVIKVNVEGRAREIVSAGIEIVATVLRNGTDLKFEGTEFKSGDDMYLYFKSPVDGYLAVYLLDEGAEDVYCLLPYKSSTNGAMKVEHDKEYVLFSENHSSEFEKSQVDEYTMTCENDIEYNDLYVIFSSNQFTKAHSTDSGNEVLPRILKYDDFQKWLVKCRKYDKVMVLSKIQLGITK